MMANVTIFECHQRSQILQDTGGFNFKALSC